MPAWCISSIASAAISGVCSAGLAIAALPAASAAATGPMKIASGKFHGLMQANTPRPWRRSSLSSPVGPGSGGRRGELGARLAGVIAQEIDRLAHFEHGVGQRLAGLADAQARRVRRDAPRTGRRRGRAGRRGPRRRARSQSCCAACAARTARSTSAAVASATVPTVSAVSNGETTGTGLRAARRASARRVHERVFERWQAARPAARARADR